jgi:pilus assembly protein Flp/PilA
MKLIQKLFRVAGDRSGATVIEYCLIAGIICIAIVAGATSLGQSANDSYTAVATGVWG